jgi:hypothetical protein
MNTFGKPNWSNGTPKSELELLLEKNCDSKGLITQDEVDRAWELIQHPEYYQGNCWCCEGLSYRFPNQDIRAVYDTGLCKGHAEQALRQRK